MPTEADGYYHRFFDVLGQNPKSPGPASESLAGWHLNHRWAYELATHPNIVARLAEILGDDLVFWAMYFWYKPPGNDKYIPWHQDRNYWPMEPEINASAWVSLGHSTAKNGCLRIIPGTHQHKLAHIKSTDAKSSFGERLSEEGIDVSTAVSLEMTPGQGCFFNESTVHGSNANSSQIPRVAFSVRYTTPEVRFKVKEWGEGIWRIRTFLVRGEDHYRLNDAIRGEIPQ